MSSPVIELKNVTKIYKRFSTPFWQAMHALGIPVSSNKFDTFNALTNINLLINKGETVALIGRNGAGKSTLLRVISKQLKIDEGIAIINGDIQALMELGTGFHPDFTAIENIRSSLSYQGIQGEKLQTHIDEIIEFTELEEFANRPVREYSAGMYARLAFAVATALVPDILIVDEILGAGDAYFMGKCITRMKNLTSRGATVLFVSHDISSVQTLCKRGIWIEQGQVKADGDVLQVSKAYLHSVREDEEIRLRAKTLAISRSMAAYSMKEKEINFFRLNFNGLQETAKLSLLQIKYGDKSHSQLIPFEKKSKLETESRLLCNYELNPIQDKNFKCLFTLSPNNCTLISWQINWQQLSSEDRWLELQYECDKPIQFQIEFYDEQSKLFKSLAYDLPHTATSGQNQSIRVPMPAIEHSDTQEVNTENQISAIDRYGSGPLKITDFYFQDAELRRRHTLITGEEANFVITYQAESIIDPVATVSIYKPDGTCAMQVTTLDDERTLGKLHGRGLLTFNFAPLLLGPGDYYVSVAFFKELTTITNIEPEAYDLHDRSYTLKVLPPANQTLTIGTVNQPCNWMLSHG